MKTTTIRANSFTLDHYPQWLLSIMLGGSVLLSFTPYWLDSTTLFDNKRFFIIFYLLLTAFALLCSASLRERIIDSVASVSPLNRGLFFVGLAAALFANLTSLYWVKSQAVFAYLLMLMMTAALLRSSVLDNKDLIIRLYIWLTAGIFASAFLFHLIATWQGSVPNYRYLFSFVNPRNINHIQIWLILPLLYWAWNNRQQTRAWLYCLPVVLHFSLLFTLDARGAFIASFGGITLWIALSPNKLQHLKWVLTLLACGLALKWLLFTPLPQYFIQGAWPDGQGDIRLSDSNRLALWSNALALISFWGHGGDTFVCNNHVIAHTPHNSVLLTAVEWGIITTVCYVSLLLVAFYRICTTHNETLRVLGITMLSGFAYSLISGVLNTPLSQGLAVISVALYWAAASVNAPTAPARFSIKWSHGAILLTCIWAIVFVGNKAYQRIDNNQYRHLKLDYYMPQFWIEHNCMDAEPKLSIPAR